MGPPLTLVRLVEFLLLLRPNDTSNNGIFHKIILRIDGLMCTESGSNFIWIKIAH